jgi:hypothetical protein
LRVPFFGSNGKRLSSTPTIFFTPIRNLTLIEFLSEGKRTFLALPDPLRALELRSSAAKVEKHTRLQNLRAFLYSENLMRIDFYCGT